MKQLHGLRVRSATIGSLAPLSLKVIEDGEDRIIIEGSLSAMLSADEARFFAKLLIEAADRVAPKPREDDQRVPNYQESSNNDDENIDTADIPETDQKFFDKAILRASDKSRISSSALKPFALRKPKTPSMWTPERNALLREEVPRGRLTREQLYAELSALPGPAITNVGRLGTQASQLGLTWPEEAPQTPQEPPAEAAAIEAAPEPEEPPQPTPAPAYDEPKPRFADAAMLARFSRRPDPAEEQEADRVEVLEFAAKCGLPFADWDADLERINKKRRDLGLPKFVQKPVFSSKRERANAG